MADLILDMDYDIRKAEAKQRKLQAEFEQSKKAAENIKREIEKLNQKSEAEKETQLTIKNTIKEQEAEVKKLSAQIEKMENHTDGSIYDFMDTGGLGIAKERLKEIEDKIKSENKELEKSMSAYKKINSQIDKQNLSLDKQNAKTQKIGDEIKLNQTKTSRFSKSLEKSEKTMDRFGKRIKSLMASALLFSVITKAFTALREEFGKMLTQEGTKTADLIAKIKGNLSVLGTTLYESARPYIEWFLQKLTDITELITYGIAKMLGKSVDEMKALTKATKKAGEAAKKATASFDTLQTLNSSENSSDSSSSVNYDALDGDIKEELIGLFALVSGALLVLGVILAFTGVNIPLGLGLIAIGAVGLATALVPNWNSMTEKTKNTITKIMAIVSSALLVLGVILCVTGVGIPLGIGLILLGAAGLATAVALKEGTLKEKITQVFNDIKSFIAGWGLLVLGIILCISGLGIPLGLALILAGSKNLTKQKDPVWNAILTKIKEVWNSIKSWWNSNVAEWFTVKKWKELAGKIGTGLKSGVLSAINNIKTAFSSFTNWIKSKFTFNIDIPDWATNFFSGSSKSSNIKIPGLATGAVLPGGSPMLAWVNDQPKGQGYVEGSIDNIAAAFEKYLGDKGFGNQNITLEAKGSMAQLIRLLNIEIKKENTRSSIWG